MKFIIVDRSIAIPVYWNAPGMGHVRYRQLAHVYDTETLDTCVALALRKRKDVLHAIPVQSSENGG